MGYTHYWRHKGFTDSQWAEFTQEVKGIFAGCDTPIADGHGAFGTKPVVGDKSIMFNGVAPEKCETCCVTRAAQDFEFCKTRQFPYDEVVVAVLRAARRINPSFAPSSDGDPGVFSDPL